jgi:succinyl-diaminopimelate desuccinylase
MAYHQASKINTAFRHSEPRENDTLEELFRKLIALPTISDDIETNHEALHFAGDYLEARGMHVRYVPPTPDMHEALLASTRPDNAMSPSILLAAHIDVMTAGESMFTLRKEKGRHFGRGVYDMKFAIAAYLKVVDQLEASLPEYDFAILLTSDEELGGRDGVNGVRELVHSGLRPKVVILPDGGENWQLETASNGYIHLLLEAHGKTGHSSRPWMGDNAVMRLVSALHDLGHHFSDQGPDTDTFNIAAIKTSDVPVNQIPDYAAAELSIRLRHVGALVHWQRIVADVCREHGITHTERVSWEAIHNDLDNPFVRRFADLIEEIVGIKVVGFHSYAGSDTRFFAEVGVPYINAYPYGGDHHSSNEWLSEESLYQFQDIVLRYVKEIA